MIKTNQKDLDLFESLYTGTLLLSYISDMQHGNNKMRRAEATMAVQIITQILRYFNIKKIKVSMGNQLSYCIDWKLAKKIIPMEFILEK